ncbi:hypothetical protein L915_06109 [Phytophthora nicotianae]|uniref:Uncharacterized protein n=1 Tax=Phytophthora nicotianae TaxID=4792 RepID=W2H4F2_PHYNI|nr:hypothetical protein L915_06109 [Phytophthora nicotianae]
MQPRTPDIGLKRVDYPCVKDRDDRGEFGSHPAIGAIYQGAGTDLCLPPLCSSPLSHRRSFRERDSHQDQSRCKRDWLRHCDAACAVLRDARAVVVTPLSVRRSHCDFQTGSSSELHVSQRESAHAVNKLHPRILGVPHRMQHNLFLPIRDNVSHYYPLGPHKGGAGCDAVPSLPPGQKDGATRLCHTRRRSHRHRRVNYSCPPAISHHHRNRQQRRRNVWRA